MKFCAQFLTERLAGVSFVTIDSVKEVLYIEAKQRIALLSVLNDRFS